MKEYVLGYAYHKVHTKKYIVLIRKTHPQCMRGLLNGVGGKLEGEETPHEAMVREFLEETGVPTTTDSWILTDSYVEKDAQGDSAAKIHVFIMKLTREQFQDLSSPTDETVETIPFDNLKYVKLVHSPWFNTTLNMMTF